MRPAKAAVEAEAPLIECALKIFISIQARSNIDVMYLAMKDEVIGL